MYLIKSCWSCPKTWALNARALFTSLEMSFPRDPSPRQLCQRYHRRGTPQPLAPTVSGEFLPPHHSVVAIVIPTSLVVLFARWRVAFPPSQSQHLNKNKFTVCRTGLRPLSLSSFGRAMYEQNVEVVHVVLLSSCTKFCFSSHE